MRVCDPKQEENQDVEQDAEEDEDGIVDEGGHEEWRKEEEHAEVIDKWLRSSTNSRSSATWSRCRTSCTVTGCRRSLSASRTKTPFAPLPTTV
jgi:hypothetical protein